MDVEEAKRVIRAEEEQVAALKSPLSGQASLTMTPSDSEHSWMKVHLMVGPMSIDTEAEPERIIYLVKRMVQEFMSAGIIPKV